MANQRAMLRDYASLHDDLADSTVMELCDDGYSGTNFERPVVKKLLELTKERRVHYIIVKDFSRFGREHIAVSDYVDQIFPFLGIRFISVNDGYDSEQCFGMTGGFDINLRNVMSVRAPISKSGGSLVVRKSGTMVVALFLFFVIGVAYSKNLK